MSIRMRRGLFIYILTVLLVSCTDHKATSLSSWVKNHVGEEDFIEQVHHLVDSVGRQSPDSLESFVRRIANALCESGNERLAVSVAGIPYGLNISPDEYSEIGKRLLVQLQLTGNAAPPMPLKEINKGREGFIVFFFESDCYACRILIDELKANYDSLQTKGIHIVSIASDNDKEIYESFASSLPWEEKYCDYHSFDGEYFKIWGVASTPTMYYVDKRGVVKGRYYEVKDIIVVQ